MKVNQVPVHKPWRRGMSLLELTVTLSALLLLLAVAMIGREASVDAAARPEAKPVERKMEKKRPHPTKIVVAERLGVLTLG